MSTDDEEYEAKQAESGDWVEWEAQLDPALAVPAPERFVVDRVRLEQGILARLTPEQRDGWDVGLFRYQFGGFDDQRGWGWLAVTDRTGGRVVGFRCHWSSLAPR